MTDDQNLTELPADGRVGRRGLLMGAGAAMVAGAVAMPQAASADTVDRSNTGIAPRGSGDEQGAFGSPVSSGLGSAPISGYTYRSLSMYDFYPFWPDSKRQWNGYGTHCLGVAGPMRGSIEIPAGALVRDVEYYVSNNSGTNVIPFAAIYVPGSGTITVIGAQPTISSSASGIQTAYGAITESNWGPYPLGTRLILNVDTLVNGLVQINGARVGFTRGASTTGVLPAPVRAYDSRSSSKLAAGTTRTITLPSTVVKPGMVGVVANITAVSGSGAGYLKVYAGNVAAPDASALNFPSGTAIANSINVAVSNSRQIKVFASKSVHVIVDITGTIG